MRSVKQKLLRALDCLLDDISEERLVDILLDAYKAKRDRITELEGENARERVLLQTEREQIHDAHRRMNSDPLYGASGRYYFVVNKRKFCVQIEGGRRIQMFERQAHIDFAAEQIRAEDFE